MLRDRGGAKSRDYRMGSPCARRSSRRQRRRDGARRRATSAARGGRAQRSPRDGGCRSGTMIGIIPAASAARTPGSESSSTRQEAAFAPSRARRLDVDVGRGLSERDLVAADDFVEARRGAPCARACSRARSRRVDVATARGIALASSQLEQFVDAGLECQPFALDDGVVRGMPAGEERVDGIAARRSARAASPSNRRSCARSSLARAPCRNPRPTRPRLRPTRAPRAARCRASARPCRR